MTDLEKFQRVNACETIEELCECIFAIADEHGEIQGRNRKFNAGKQALGAMAFFTGAVPRPNVITREFGLRHQVIYLRFYALLEEMLQPSSP